MQKQFAGLTRVDVAYISFNISLSCINILAFAMITSAMSFGSTYIRKDNWSTIATK